MMQNYLNQYMHTIPFGWYIHTLMLVYDCYYLYFYKI